MLEIETIEVSVTQMGFALILKPPGKSRIVPVFIGPLEAYSISMAQQGRKTERPLTHDLMKTVLDSLSFGIKKIVVNDFQEGTFFAKVYFENKNDPKSSLIEVDARPSDAIAMAIRLSAPIFMAKEVYEQTAIEMNELREHIQREELSIEEESQILDTLFSSLEDSPSISSSQSPRGGFIHGILSEFDQPPEKETKSEQEKQTYSSSPSSKTSKEDFQSRGDVLKQMLKAAIKQERYEDAALIRDELKEFERSSENQSPGKKKNRKKNLSNKKSN